MENIAILGLRDKLTEIDKGINECANKNGSSMKSLLHIKDELNKAITILKACEGEMTKEGYGQLTIPVVINWVSVTERMPDLEWGDYMVCLENNAILIANYSRIGSERWLRVGIGEIKNTNPVKYWAELPESPCLYTVL